MSIRDDFFAALASGAKWDVGVSIGRTNPVPLDSKSVFESDEALTSYAQGVLAYPGQIVAVVYSDNSVKVFVLDGNKNPVELGSGNGSAMIFVDTVAALKTLGTPPTGVPDDLSVGQQVFVSADRKIYFLTALGATAPTSYVWESQASDAPVWDSANATINGSKVEFKTATADTFDPSNYTDTGIIYFVTVGTDNHVVFNGQDFSDQLSEDEIKSLSAEVVLEALGKIGFDKYTGLINNEENSTSFELTTVAHAPTYDATNLKLTIPVYGGSDVVVNIPKDKFVTAGKYYDVYPEGAIGESAQHQVIVLTIENQTEPVIIPAASLVNILTAENTNTITMQISDDDKISASIKIDPSSDNAITSSASGIKVDLSGKMDKIAGAEGDKIAVTDADGNVDESAFDIQSTGDLSSMTANDIPVATVIAAAINAVQTTISQGKLDKLNGSATDAGKLVVVGADGASITFGTLTVQDIQTALANKVDKISGTENDIVTFGTDGAIKDSGKIAGGATLAANPNANTLATEAAVNAAMSWIEI